MSDHLEPHALAALFPPISDDELQALADDIRQHGQREPVLTFEGKVLDGWNRVRACRLIGIQPWSMEFDPTSAKMTPEALVISANLRRRHLSVGQMSAIVVELSEKIELEGGSMRDAFVGEFAAKSLGRPKTALTLAAELVGMDERRGRDARAVKEASAEVFTQLKRGVITLNEAMEKIRPPAEAEPSMPVSQERPSEAADQAALDAEAAEPVGVPIFAREPMADPPSPLKGAATKPAPATKAAEMVRPPPSETVLNKALERIKNVVGKVLHAEVKGGLIPKPWDVVAFSKLPEAEMRDIAPLLRRGWVYSEAVDEVARRLSPDDEIRALHSRAVQAGGRLKTTVAGFVHVVVMEDQAQELEARLQGW